MLAQRLTYQEKREEQERWNTTITTIITTTFTTTITTITTATIITVTIINSPDCGTFLPTSASPSFLVEIVHLSHFDLHLSPDHP